MAYIMATISRPNRSNELTFRMEADDADDFLGLDGPDAAFEHREDRARPQVEAIVEAGCRQEYAADARGSGGHHVGDGLPRIFSFSANGGRVSIFILCK